MTTEQKIIILQGIIIGAMIVGTITIFHSSNSIMTQMEHTMTQQQIVLEKQQLVIADQQQAFHECLGTPLPTPSFRNQLQALPGNAL